MSGKRGVRKYVRGACQRCRRQKLKCDIHRPCMLCSRAGIECVASSARVSSYKNGKRTSGHGQSAYEQREHSPTSNIDVSETQQIDESITTTHHQTNIPTHDLPDLANASTANDILPSPTRVEPESSATMALVETAFLFHESHAPSTPTAATQSQLLHPKTVPINRSRYRSSRPCKSADSGLYNKLISALPDREVTDLLVDTYFDCVHWFILLFYQRDFRLELEHFYEQRHCGTTELESAGFLSTLLVVACIGLQYLGPYRQTLLQRHGICREDLQARIEATLQESFFAIVSLGTLEAAHSCVLLGTFYLYHGNAAAAWPICGCALRIAQALDLHRKWPVQEGEPTVLSPEMLHKIEARKRCWWAVYEVETFCYMLYGYNIQSSDAASDVGLLNPSSDSAGSLLQESSILRAKLLNYKLMMSKLSIIIKTALVELYSSSEQIGATNKLPTSDKVRLQQLVTRVSHLEKRLQQWQKELPAELRASSTHRGGYQTFEEYEKDIGGFGTVFDEQILQLQALALKFAFENARILVHRPLLSYQVRAASRDLGQGITTRNSSTLPPHPFQCSLRICYDAGLQISDLGALPVFKLATRTYAAAFISTHLFTAGVALCLSASFRPLSEQAATAKRGLRKLIQMQRDSLAAALPSSHATEILEQLTKLLLEKELASIIGAERPVAPAIRNPEELANLGDNQRCHTETGTQGNIPAQLPSDPLPRALTPPISNMGTTSDYHTIDNSPEISYNRSYNHDPALAEPFQGLEDVPSDEVDLMPAAYSLSPLFSIPFDDAILQDQEQAWIWSMYRD